MTIPIMKMVPVNRPFGSTGRSLLLLLFVLLLVAGCEPNDADVAEVGPVATLVEEDGSRPSVALDPGTGSGYVVWVGGDDGVFDVYLGGFDAGASTFRPIVRVNDIPGDAAPHEQAPARVAVGSGEEVYVLWQNNTYIEGRFYPASDLRFAVSRDGGRNFDPAITVNDDAGELPSSHTFHDLVVGKDGSVYVSWIDSREQDRARAEAGLHARHGEGVDAAAVGPEIRVARSTDGGRTFAASTVIDTSSCPCCQTSIAAGTDGSVYVAWRKVFPGEVRDIVVARSEPGGAVFEEPVRAHPDDWVFPGCPHAGPSIAVDAEGRVHIAWYTGHDERQGLWYAVSEDGARSFGTPLPLVTGDFVPPSLVSLAPAPGGVWVGWEDRTAEISEIFVGFSYGARAPRSLRAAPQGARSPAFASRGSQALLAWVEGEAVRARWLSLPR